MENKLQILTVANVRGYEKNGTVYLNLEDVARGLGFVESNKFSSVNGYLQEFGYPHDVGKDDYIPENMFYRLAMKAKNEVAEKFQILVADEILPAIRKHGVYATKDFAKQAISNPAWAIEILTALQQEREEKERLQELVSIQSVQIEEMKPKVTYYDLILQSKEAMPVSVIAKDYGLSGKAMNQLLHQLKIQYPCGGTWLVYQDFASKGYTQTKTIPISDRFSKTHTNWTQKGRLFLYEILKQNGYLPLIEQIEE